jgi:hypothetical protein
MGGACSAHWGDKLIKIFVGNPQRNRPVVRRGRRWEDNIKTDFRKFGVGGTDWIHLAQDRDSRRIMLNTAMILRTP